MTERSPWKILGALTLIGGLVFLGTRKHQVLSEAARAELKRMPVTDRNTALKALSDAGMSDLGEFFYNRGTRAAGDALMELAALWETKGYAHLAREARERAVDLGSTPAASATVSPPDPSLLSEMQAALNAVGLDAYGNVVGPPGTPADIDRLKKLATKLRAAGLPESADQLLQLADKATERQAGPK